ncbi:MAG: nucleotide exchange factor GrpE [Candidatus Thorarchaeota archaeon]
MPEKENGHQELDEVDMSSDDVRKEIELTPEQELEKALEIERNNSSELLDNFQRLQAEFDNYRKRMTSRISESVKFANEGILLKILEIYDNIKRALEVDFSSDPIDAKTGIQAIHLQIDKLLSQEEVRSFESLRKSFDPYYQHAISVTHDAEISDNIVVEEYKKGYMLSEKVLRPALVCVNRHEIPEETSNEDDKHKENGDE